MKAKVVLGSALVRIPGWNKLEKSSGLQIKSDLRYFVSESKILPVDNTIKYYVSNPYYIWGEWCMLVEYENQYGHLIVVIFKQEEFWKDRALARITLEGIESVEYTGDVRVDSVLLHNYLIPLLNDSIIYTNIYITTHTMVIEDFPIKK